MLEKEVIQVRGFHNIMEDGAVTGYQFRVRLESYRGQWLCMMRFDGVEVDGQKIANDDMVWCIGGVDYTIDQMADISKVQWPISEAAVVKVKKAGGLAQGYHDFVVAYRHIAAYIPPMMDDSPMSRERGRFTRKLLLV